MMELDFSHRNSIDKKKWISNLRDTAKADWEKEILVFLTDWFSGKDTFEIKTSGTTGPPKIVLFSRSALITSARITIKTFKLKKGNTLLMCLPTKFVAGKMMLVRAIVGEMKIIALKPTSNPINKLHEKIDFAAFTPHQLIKTIQLNPKQLNFIDTAIIGGSPLSLKLQKQLNNYRTRFFETFGMSETLTHMAIKTLNGINKSEFFKVLDGFKISKNKDNHLIISAKHLANSPLITADIIELIDKNTFNWLGRGDDVINSGGVKHFPAIIEKKLDAILDNEFYITKKSDQQLGEKVVLFIEGKAASKRALKLLKAEIGNALEKYEVPGEIIFMDKFFRNKNGKIIRTDRK